MQKVPDHAWQVWLCQCNKEMAYGGFACLSDCSFHFYVLFPESWSTPPVLHKHRVCKGKQPRPELAVLFIFKLPPSLPPKVKHWECDDSGFSPYKENMQTRYVIQLEIIQSRTVRSLFQTALSVSINWEVSRTLQSPESVSLLDKTVTKFTLQGAK